MKMATLLFILLLLVSSCGAMAGANIVDGNDSDNDNENTTDNPYAQYDPDGVPLYITQGKRRRAPSAAEIAAMRKQQEQVAYEKNWLLRGYEEQLRLHSKEATSDPNSTGEIYYQLSLNKDLSKLARIQQTPENPDSSALKVKPAAKGKSEAPTPSTPPGPNGKPAPMTLSNYKPLLTPLSEVSAAAQNSFSFTWSSPFSNNNNANPAPSAGPKPKIDLSLDSVDMETPGMVAAKSDSAPDVNMTDMPIDALPGETADQARARIERNNNPQLAVPMSADELHRQQADALAPPGSKIAGKKDEPPPVPVAQPLPPQTPLPVTKLPPVNAGRSTIPDPFDVLNH